MLFDKPLNALNHPIKLRYWQDAKLFIEKAKKDGKRVVVVTGCFDILHIGHIRFLNQAKAAGDVLVVGIEDDNRVRAFKGASRLHNPGQGAQGNRGKPHSLTGAWRTPKPG